MRAEGINDVTIFRSSRYLYVGAGLVVCQMSVIQDQYFLTFFQIVCQYFISIHTLVRQELPQSGRTSKFFYLNSDIDIDIYKQCGIAYFEQVKSFLIPY